MKRLLLTCSVILVALTLAAAGCQQRSPAEPDGASLATVEMPIVNGTTTTGWPAVGALTTSLPFYGYQGSFCTGTLIAPRWVLTAGHCVVGDADPATTYFMIGNDATPSYSVNGPKDGTLYGIDGFYPHPQYNDNTLDNDIALVHLSQPVTDVAPLEINAAYLNAVGQDAHYVGFGATEGIQSTGGGIKRETDVAIGWIYDTQFTSDYAGTGTCFGDSGGPAFLNYGGTWRIIGVNSAGVDCNPNVHPNCPVDPCQRESITTRVDPYASWIASTTNASTPTCLDDATLCACPAACGTDGICDNTACQVQDCAATYDCLVNCADNAACQSACYASATETAQSQLDALFQCIGAACGDLTGDAYNQCVSTSCGAQVDACFPVGNGPWTCREVYDCIVECPSNDDQCPMGCYGQGTEQAQAEFDALNGCLSDQCGSAADFQACASAQCGAEIDTCFPTLTGPASCEEVVDCMSGCADNDNNCLYGCYETGTATAQDQYSAIIDCVDAHCADLSGDAYAQCLGASCGAEFDACFPPAHCPLTGGGCGADEACYPTRSGATDCFASNGKPVGAACDGGLDVLDCGDGAICVDSGDGGVCELWCTTDAVCGPGATCEKPLIEEFPDYGVCGCEDVDGDGTCAEGDCLDTDASAYPGAAEACGDGVDNDCDGATDEDCGTCVDADGDGYCAEADCADGDANANPGAAEKCGDSVDNDCDGATDEDCGTCVDADGDGYCAEVDCFDGDASAHPGAAEVCGDGKDNDCSGAADDGCADNPNNPDTNTTTPVNPGWVSARNSGGCAGGGTGGAPWLTLGLLLGWVALRRRRAAI